MRFSERYGYKPVREIIQNDSMNELLRNALWSILKLFVWDQVAPGQAGFPTFECDPDIKSFCDQLWFEFYKQPIDTIHYDWGAVLKRIRKEFFECEWYEVYDFVEFVVVNFPYSGKAPFITACNRCLEREGSAYRLVDGLITRVTDEVEIDAIEVAFEKARGPVRTHLRRALELLSDRENPDYRNSIKESISAVESLVGIILGEKGTLGDLLKKLETEIGLHPALKKAFSNLYGYTSDEDGIRHAILESKQITFEDAKFFLVVCSAFVNFANARVAAPQP